MRVKMFTHTDLDGVSCGILGKLAFTEIDIEYCNYDDIDEKVQEYIKEKQYIKYDLALITDIRISNETADLINNTEPEEFKDGFSLSEQFIFIDHHKTSLDLGDYFWVKVSIERNGKKDSGTSLLYEYLLADGYLKKTMLLDYFVEEVRRYDTWEWADVYKVDSPKMLNDLFYIYGRTKFTEDMLNKLVEEYKFDKGIQDIIIREIDKFVLRVEKRRIEKYIDAVNETMIIKEVQGFKAGVVFAEQYISELAHKILDWNSEIELALVINMQKGIISFRSRQGGVDVSDIAKLYGGGGHKNAAGCQIDREYIYRFIEGIIQ